MFSDYIISLQFLQKAENAEKRFFAINFDNLFENKNEITSESNEFYESLKDMIFFLPPKVKEKLDDIGFKKEQKWLISLKKVDEELNKINKNKDIFIFKSLALHFINEFLSSKLFNSMLMFLDKTNDAIKSGSTYNLGHSSVHNFLRRREGSRNRSGKFSNDYYELIVHYQFNAIQEVLQFSDGEFRNFIGKITQGEATKIFLSALMDNIYVNENNKFTDKKFHLSIIDLFLLLMKDAVFYTKEEFEDHYSDNGDYEKYMVKTLKGFIMPNKITSKYLLSLSRSM